MDFTFSEDQIALRDTISRFLMTEAAPEHLRDIWETQSGHAPELWAKLAEQGLLGLSVPEAEGGMGMTDIDWALLLQETGYYALPECVSDTGFVAAGMLTALPEGHPVRARWLPRIAAGECGIAIGHPLNQYVLGASMANLLLMPHATEAGLELHAVLPADCSITPMRSIDSSRRLCQVQWTPSAATCVLDGASGSAVWQKAGLRGTLAASAQLIGLAQRMLDLSVDYAAQRKQFDRAIGSFQAVQHHLADIVTRIEFAKPVLYRAFYALQHGEPEAALRVSHAKLQCGEAGWFAARHGLQVHGAMGYTWEVDLQMFMKRAWVLDAAWGDRAYHSGNLAAGLLDSEQAPIGPGHTFDRQGVHAAGQPAPACAVVCEEVAA